MNTLFILFLVGLVAINLVFWVLKKRMGATQPQAQTSFKDLVSRYAVIFAVSEDNLFDIAARATLNAPLTQYESIIKECARALKQRIDMEERNSLDELLARYAVLEYVPKDELSTFVRKAISSKTPVSQYEKIVEKAARNLRQRKAAELAKAEKEESTKNLD